jgi:hypothetical protein
MSGFRSPLPRKTVRQSLQSLNDADPISEISQQDIRIHGLVSSDHLRSQRRKLHRPSQGEAPPQTGFTKAVEILRVFSVSVCSPLIFSSQSPVNLGCEQTYKSSQLQFARVENSRYQFVGVMSAYIEYIKPLSNYHKLSESP